MGPYVHVIETENVHFCSHCSHGGWRDVLFRVSKNLIVFSCLKHQIGMRTYLIEYLYIGLQIHCFQIPGYQYC